MAWPSSWSAARCSGPAAADARVGMLSSMSLCRPRRRRRADASCTAIRVSHVEKPCPAGELVKVLKGAHVGVLGHVLGLPLVPHDRPCDPIEPLVVAAHEN